MNNIPALDQKLACNISYADDLKLLCLSTNILQIMLDICDGFFFRKNIVCNIMLARLLPFVKVNPVENPSDLLILTDIAYAWKHLGNIWVISIVLL